MRDTCLHQHGGRPLLTRQSSRHLDHQNSSPAVWARYLILTAGSESEMCTTLSVDETFYGV